MRVGEWYPTHQRCLAGNPNKCKGLTHGRASHTESGQRLQLGYCLCLLCRFVLDPLCFVKDDSVPFALVTQEGKIVLSARRPPIRIGAFLHKDVVPSLQFGGQSSCQKESALLSDPGIFVLQRVRGL